MYRQFVFTPAKSADKTSFGSDDLHCRLYQRKSFIPDYADSFKSEYRSTGRHIHPERYAA